MSFEDATVVFLKRRAAGRQYNIMPDSVFLSFWKHSKISEFISVFGNRIHTAHTQTFSAAGTLVHCTSKSLLVGVFFLFLLVQFE